MTTLAATTTRGAFLGVASTLSYAASPVFALMAVLTQVYGTTDAMCSAMPMASPSLLSGMVPMYLLMSAFHAAAWLRLLAGRAQADR
jgi:hypothetical protein